LALHDRIRSRDDRTIEPLTPTLVDEGLTLYRARPDKSWSLTDCVSFTLMTDRQITRALAYDHHFEQAGFEALLRRDPP
jgi:predicted nucleic acid-binding protein